MVNEPENDEPACVICHVIVPGPDESDASPLHEPVVLDGVDGEVGLGEDEEPDDPPLQARLGIIRPTATASRAATRSRCIENPVALRRAVRTASGGHRGKEP
jgi:hypothetical protein